MSTAFASREISSTSLLALGERAVREDDARPGRQLRMPVVALVRGYTRARARVHTHTHAHVRNSAFLPLARSVGHRTRGRSKINGRGGYARSLLAARQCWRTDVDRGSQTALRRMHSGASRNHQDGKTARVRTHVHREARPTNATVLSTRYFGLETLNS